jgi:tetratricopeptide (TPR) repeat protein
MGTERIGLSPNVNGKASQLNTYPKFNVFRMDKGMTEYLVEKITLGLHRGKASVYAISFLADYNYSKGEFDEALAILESGREINKEGIVLWVKEAEINMREGSFSAAARCIDSARRREAYAESPEATWKLTYWDLINSFILKRYQNARKCIIDLLDNSYYPRQSTPRGYIWKKDAINVPPKDRIFRDHAKIYSGRIKNIKTEKGSYGQIELSNESGETLFIEFNRRYFKTRRDLRPGQPINFAVALLPNGLRAENLDITPFVETVDDIFL